MFDDLIAFMEANKKIKLIPAELFMKERKLSISFVFISQYYCKVPKDIRLNVSHCFIMKIPNKRELQQIALSHYKDYTKEPFSFLVNNTIFRVCTIREKQGTFSMVWRNLCCLD